MPDDDLKGAHDDLLRVLADMVTMPIPQQAMVLSDVIGSAAGAMAAQKGWTRQQAVKYVLGRMIAKINAVRPH